MIKVNMLDTSRIALNEVIAKTKQALRDRSFSGRNQHLGKMINCPICDKRHRENWVVTSIARATGENVSDHIGLKDEEGRWVIETVPYRCIAVYAKARYQMHDDGTPMLEEDKTPLIASQKTRKGIYGAQAFAKKRHNPHHNKKDLLLVQRTIEKFPMFKPYSADPLDAMRLARTEAQREIEKAKQKKQVKKRNISKKSRNINQKGA